MIGPDACERRDLGVRVSVLFAAIFVVAGTNLPYLPVWLDWRGLEAREIAIITATPLFVRVVVTPAIAFAADRAGDHRRFLVGLSWCGLAALAALSQSSTFWPILISTVAFALAWTTIMPLTETVALNGVKAAGLDYGRMRLWGSLSFIAASLGGGSVVGYWGAASAIWLVLAGGVLTTLAAHWVARPIGLGRPKAALGPSRLRLADALGLLSARPFLVFLLATGAIQAAHAMFYTFGTLHWAGQGLSAGWSGMLWAIGVLAEIAIFVVSAALIRHVGAPGLIAVAAMAAVGRWLAMGFDPPLPWLMLLQMLHGLTFGAAHVGAIHFMARAVPDWQTGTSQALYASVTSGIAMGAATLVSGPLYAQYAGRAYWAMAVVAAVGLGASLVLMRTRRDVAVA
ncbi:MAG: MFS transporter [Hyphomonadaceae bacterium]|nr:MFS transporter [Hyphomonadaceae bacterium]